MTTLVADLEPALSLLRTQGYTESEVRDHSPAWVRDRVDEYVKRRNADQARAIFHAAVAFAGSQTEAGNDAMQEVIAALDPEQESLDEHLLNPNAQTDWTAVRASGIYQEGSDANQ